MMRNIGNFPCHVNNIYGIQILLAIRFSHDDTHDRLYNNISPEYFFRVYICVEPTLAKNNWYSVPE